MSLTSNKDFITSLISSHESLQSSSESDSKIVFNLAEELKETALLKSVDNSFKRVSSINDIN